MYIYKSIDKSVFEFPVTANFKVLQTGLQTNYRHFGLN